MRTASDVRTATTPRARRTGTSKTFEANYRKYVEASCECEFRNDGFSPCLDKYIEHTGDCEWPDAVQDELEACPRSTATFAFSWCRTAVPCQGLSSPNHAPPHASENASGAISTATTSATGSVTLSMNMTKAIAAPLASAGSSTLSAPLARAIR